MCHRGSGGGGARAVPWLCNSTISLSRLAIVAPTVPHKPKHPAMPTKPIRIFVTSDIEVSQVWLMFCQQTAIDVAEVWQGKSFLFLMIRHDKGLPSRTRVPRGAFQGDATPQPDPAAP